MRCIVEIFYFFSIRNGFLEVSFYSYFVNVTITLFSGTFKLIMFLLFLSEGLQVADYQFVNLIADKNKLVVEMRVHIQFTVFKFCYVRYLLKRKRATSLTYKQVCKHHCFGHLSIVCTLFCLISVKNPFTSKQS